jgi:hypothetical protein
VKAANLRSDIAADPFAECAGPEQRWRTRVLGARFEFLSDSAELLALARKAFDRVPGHRSAGASRGTLRVHLRRVRDGGAGRKTPPRPLLSSGAGLLCGHSDANNFVIIDARAGAAFIQVGDSWLQHPELLRYELLEFAVITLATRAQRLVSLHAACVGWRGRGLLLLGDSGVGKSTLALHAALNGLEYLAEDSVFLEPASLRATGLSAFVHARDDALKLIRDSPTRRAVAESPWIRRRSGVRKREFDLRDGAARLAPRPLEIVGVVLLSPRLARGRGISPLSEARLRRELHSGQAFARHQPGWSAFEARVLRASRFELGRMPPEAGVRALREILESDA